VDNLYTEHIRRFIHSYRPELPSGLRMDTVEYDDHLALRFYRDNFDAFDGVDRLRIVKIIDEMIKGIWKMGCPCYTEALPNVPR